MIELMVIGYSMQVLACNVSVLGLSAPGGLGGR